MKIDIDKLTEAELVDLNNRIVERLRFLTHMRDANGRRGIPRTRLGTIQPSRLE